MCGSQLDVSGELLVIFVDSQYSNRIIIEMTSIASTYCLKKILACACDSLIKLSNALIVVLPVHVDYDCMWFYYTWINICDCSVSTGDICLA